MLQVQAVDEWTSVEAMLSPSGSVKIPASNGQKAYLARDIATHEDVEQFHDCLRGLKERALSIGCVVDQMLGEETTELLLDLLSKLPETEFTRLEKNVSTWLQNRQSF